MYFWGELFLNESITMCFNFLSLNVCKYAIVKNNCLYSFEKSDPRSNFNVCVSKMNDIYINVVFSDKKLTDEYKIFNDSNKNKNNIFRYVLAKPCLYDNSCVPIFLNSCSLYYNKNLKVFNNYQDFLIDECLSDYYQEILDSEKEKIELYINILFSEN